jgi:hypothetical protein
VTGIDRAVHLASWDTRGCVARDDGSVQCWIDLDDRPKDIVLSNIVEVMADRHGMCGRASNGDVQCWVIDSQIFSGPSLVHGGARGIVGGDTLICARSTSNLVCWARGETTKRVIEGVPPDAPVATGMHTCIAKRGREVVCWGHAVDGELGNGWWRRRPVPSRVPGLANVVDSAAAIVSRRRARGTRTAPFRAGATSRRVRERCRSSCRSRTCVRSAVARGRR